MVFIDLDEMAEYIVAETGCSLEQGNAYFDAEHEYLDSLGLIGLDESDSEETPGEMGPYEGAPMVENEELVRFVSERTGMSIEMVDMIAEAEMKYMKENNCAWDVESC